MQNPNTYQVQFLQLFTNLYAKFQPSFQFNFQTSPVMSSEAKVKTFTSPESVISVEVLTDCASATLTSPSLTSRTEERDSFENEKPFEISEFEEAIQAVQDSLDKEANEPSKFLRQSKKITKEKVQHRNAEENLLMEKKKSHRSKKNSWRNAEDIQLCKLFEQYGPQWTKIGKMMDKTGKQIRDRYRNKLRPDINYTEWTEEEDKLFLSLVNKYGNKWCKIASKMPGRTENQVKNKFYCLRRDRKKSNQRRNALINAIQRIENTDTNDTTKTGSVSSEHKSQENNPVGYYDVDEYFEFNQSAQWNDYICFENEVQEGQLDYIPEPFKNISL